MITLDYRDKRPIYEQVTEKLSHLIICGALGPDSRMPSVRQLAIDLSVNPNTVQRAYTQLESEGYLYSIVGRGNFVSKPEDWKNGKFKSLKEDITNVAEQAKNAGMAKSEVMDVINRVYNSEDEVTRND